MANRVLSITISDAYIKLCELTSSKNSVKVLNTMIVDTPQGTFEDGYIRNVEELGRVIKTSIKTGGIKAKNIAFTLYSTRIASRDAIIPYVKDNKISDVINTNATEYFPVNVDEYLITYTKKGEVKSEEGERRLSLIVYAAPEGMVAAYYELAEILGLQVVSVDYAGNSSSQLVTRQLGNLVTLVVHIEREYSIVSVFKEGFLRIQRIIPYGKEQVVSAVRVAREVSEKEAHTLLANERLIQGTFGEDEITDSLKTLIGNINRIIDYYNTKYPDEAIEEAVLTGESIEIMGMETLCSGELRINTKQITNLVNVAVGSNLIHSNVSKYALNIGAVLNPCRFIPKSEESKEKKRSNMKFIRLAFLLSILVSVILIVAPLPAYLAEKLRLDMVKRGIKRYEYVQKIVDEYYAYKDAYDDMQKFHSGSVNNNETLSKYIEDMEAVMPTDMSVKVMSIDNGSVTVTGVTSSKESVARFILELKGLSYTSDVVVSTMSETMTEDNISAVTFTIKYVITGYVEEVTEEEAE